MKAIKNFGRLTTRLFQRLVKFLILGLVLKANEMHDLFIELCLTVPVRLSYLLPLMNELMEPLVAALKGGQSLISQGLRTLELFVDNLQPEFLQEWILIRQSSDQIIDF